MIPARMTTTAATSTLSRSSSSLSLPGPECQKLRKPCNHVTAHYFIRCGCPNDKPVSHPMHEMDDAFHREFCIECAAFCFQNPVCPLETGKRHPLLLRSVLNKMVAFLKPPKRFISRSSRLRP
ncbi:hypothetical protein C8J56DRAFT_456022 [Mycena floridula]|nr:hypothetical protein C8J56DRAFT_456022 [Mycena floridula]